MRGIPSPNPFDSLRSLRARPVRLASRSLRARPLGKNAEWEIPGKNAKRVPVRGERPIRARGAKPLGKSAKREIKNAKRVPVRGERPIRARGASAPGQECRMGDPGQERQPGACAG